MLTEIANPIVPGFAPDPSVVFVEDTFFLVNSSFHVFPGLPIYASKDLTCWTHIGNAINRSVQINLANATTVGFPLDSDTNLIAAGGLCAPTIRWRHGVFYIICTNCRSSGDELITQNFYVTTRNIWADDWSDPISFEFQGIDPSLFFDDDDRAYIQGSWRAGNLYDPKCTIRQLEIDLSTGQPISETKEIWGGFLQKGDVEGPHLYKKDGYYYLLTAEAGTFEHHMITIARSRSVWGPFETYEKNPILTADGTKEYIQNVGHGDLFQDGSGSWWATVLGVRKENYRYPLGRESFLVPIDWPMGEWPKIGRVKMNYQCEIPSPAKRKIPSPTNDARIEDIYIRNPDLEDYKFSADGRTVLLTPSNQDLSAASGTTSFVGRRQRSLRCTATTTLHIPKREIVRAGLAVYKDDFRHAEIYFDCASGKVIFQSFHKFKSGSVVAEKALGAIRTLDLGVKATAASYEFSFRSHQEVGLVPLGSIDTSEMTALDFTGPIFGIFAHKLPLGDSDPVRFENFRISS